MLSEDVVAPATNFPATITMSSRVSTVLTVAGVTVLGGLVAYAVYFDYKRRNDVEFRKRLSRWPLVVDLGASLTILSPVEKDKKRVKQATASQASSDAESGISPEELRAALDKLRAEELPSDPEAKEQFFMAQVGMGEQLCAQGMWR